MMSLPNPGSVIRVICRSPNQYYHDLADFVDSEYEGTVVESRRWDNPNTFNVTTGIPEFPVRNIHLGSIIDLKYVSGGGTEVNESDMTPKTFRVKGSKGDEYVVTKIGMKYDCTCVGFQFKRHCKHIDKITKELR